MTETQPSMVVQESTHYQKPDHKQIIPQHLHVSAPHTKAPNTKLPLPTRLTKSKDSIFSDHISTPHLPSLKASTDHFSVKFNSLREKPTAPLSTPSTINLPKKRERYAAPLNKLTLHLVPTFNRIQLSYIAQETEEVPDLTYDNEYFDYKIMKGECFCNRYEAVSALGKGTFGQVVKCFDHQTQTFVALKIIKSKMAYTQQARRELALINEINREEGNDDYGIVRLLDHFTHRNHLCLVFELLATNLFEIVQKFNSLSITLIRKIAYQVLISLYFLSDEGLNIIHGDLKPENILLRDPTKSGVKIIDFGSSCPGNQKIYPYIQSRFYRAPEVLLELGYNQAIDMWSLGCILVELHTGEALFPGRDETDQLVKIAELLGEAPENLVQSCPKYKEFFCDPTKSNYLKHRDLFGTRTLEYILRDSPGGAKSKWQGKQGHHKENYNHFISLIKGMLHYDPNERIKPMEAIQHPFFTLEQNWCDASSNPNIANATRKRRPNSLVISSRAAKLSPKYKIRGTSASRVSRSE